MDTVFIVGKNRVKANLTREFQAGDPFHFNGTPHKVEAVLLENSHRLVHLVEASNEPETNRVPHRHRRSRKAFAGADE